MTAHTLAQPRSLAAAARSRDRDGRGRAALSVTTGSSEGPQPRIEERVRQIGEEIGHADADGDQQHDPLQERVVAILDRGERQPADTRTSRKPAR